MPKYYIKCGTLELIKSCNKDALGVAMDSVWELNEFDTIDEHFYIDERGFKDYTSAKPDTKVFKSKYVLKKAGWTFSKGEDSDCTGK